MYGSLPGCHGENDFGKREPEGLVRAARCEDSAQVGAFREFQVLVEPLNNLAEYRYVDGRVCPLCQRRK